MAPYDDGFLYRAKILPSKSNVKKPADTCLVMYVDYGNRGRVKKSDLYQLPEELMRIDGMAYKSRLHLIKKLNPKHESKVQCFNEIKHILLDREVRVVPASEGISLYYIDTVLLFPLK